MLPTKFLLNLYFSISYFYHSIDVVNVTFYVDILPALKREDSHGTAPLGWDIVVYDVTCS